MSTFTWLSSMLMAVLRSLLVVLLAIHLSGGSGGGTGGGDSDAISGNVVGVRVLCGPSILKKVNTNNFRKCKIK